MMRELATLWIGYLVFGVALACIDSPHLALWLLLNEILYRGSQLEGMTGNYGVVVDQPVGPVVVDPVAVESGQVGEQQIFVVVGEVFLDCD